MSFTDAGDAILRGVSAGLYKAGTDILAMSQPLVPVDTGTLKRSGHVEEPVFDGDSISVTVGYGYGTEYASRAAGEEATGPGYGVYVHEIVERNGKPVRHEPPTQAKFLEQPAREYEPMLGQTIQEAVDAAKQQERR